MAFHTIDNHLQAGGAGLPGEVQVTTSEPGSMLDHCYLSGVQLGARAMKAQNPPLLDHNQTSSSSLKVYNNQNRTQNQNHFYWPGVLTCTCEFVFGRCYLIIHSDMKYTFSRHVVSH